MAAHSGITRGSVPFYTRPIGGINLGEIPVTGEHLKWRLRTTEVSAGDDQVTFSEIELYTDASVATDVSPYGSIENAERFTASSEASTSYPAWEAFNSYETYDGWASEVGDEVGAWIAVELDQPEEVTGVRVVFSGTYGGNDTTPLQFVLEFYNTGLGVWVEKLICNIPVEAQTNDWDQTFRMTDDPISFGSPSLELYTADGFLSSIDNLIPLPAYSLEGSVYTEDAIADLPAYTIDATGLSGSVTNEVQIEIELPLFDGSGICISGNICSGEVSLPEITGEGYFLTESINSLPAYAAEASCYNGKLLTGSGTVPSYSCSGESLTENVGQADNNLPTYEIAGQAIAEGQATADITLTKIALSAEGYAGSASLAAVTIPAYEIDAEGYPEYVGDVAVTLPMLELVATTLATETTSGAYALNLSMRGLTQFSAYGFNSFAKFNGVTLAAGANGVFAITGENDNGTAIDASFGMHAKEGQVSRLREAVVNYRTDGQVVLRVIPEETDDVYEYTLTNSENTISKARTKLGRGIKGSNWQFEVSNVDGSDLELDYIDIVSNSTSRKVS